MILLALVVVEEQVSEIGWSTGQIEHGVTREELDEVVGAPAEVEMHRRVIHVDISNSWEGEEWGGIDRCGEGDDDLPRRSFAQRLNIFDRYELAVANDGDVLAAMLNLVEPV